MMTSLVDAERSGSSPGDAPPGVSDAAVEYWRARKDLVYYQIVRMLVDRLSEGARSMLDVGSSGCPYLDWYPDIPDRCSVDLRNPYRAAGVTSVKADFLTWQPGRKFEVVTCLQVLEHVPDAGAFAQKLLEVSDILVASVPYKWQKGRTKGHVHDPVDEEKMHRWFGRTPNYSYRCREISSHVVRLIHVYDRIPQPWKSLRHRERLLEGSAG